MASCTGAVGLEPWAGSHGEQRQGSNLRRALPLLDGDGREDKQAKEGCCSFIRPHWVTGLSDAARRKCPLGSTGPQQLRAGGSSSLRMELGLGLVTVQGRGRPRTQQREGWTSVLVAESGSHSPEAEAPSLRGFLLLLLTENKEDNFLARTTIF